MSLKRSIARLTYPIRKKISGTEPGSAEGSAMLRRAKRCDEFLKPVFDNTAGIGKKDRILLTMGKDEGKRISYFLKYYRELGFDHFLFIDNDSSEPMAERLAGQPDVSLWHTKDSYVRSKFGVDWMNLLLNRHASGHWALTVDLDEFFVFPLMENRTLTELLSYLDDTSDCSMYAPLIDMYPNGPIADAVVPDGFSPLEVADHFDSTGYFPTYGGYQDTWVRGGPRFRVFADGEIETAPTINKTPLIKWQKGFAYLSSTHAAAPYRLNQIHKNSFLGPTGALLHFKFISNLREKADYAVENKNHYMGSREYEKYLERLKEDEKINLMYPGSKKYKDTRTLIDLRMMSCGLWA